MNDIIRTSRARLVGAVALMALVSWASFGCSKTPEERLRIAKSAVIKEKPDVAKENLEKVLDEKSDSFEGRRLMAKTHMLQEDYEKAEEGLKELWKESEFDDEDKDLSGSEQETKEELEEDFVEVYMAWADSIDRDDDPDKFEEVASSALDYDADKPDLNDMLLEFYNERAEASLDDDDKAKAAEYYESVLDLRALPQEREKARDEAQELRFEINRKEFTDYFEEKGKAKFEEDDTFNEGDDDEDDTLTFSVEQSIDELEETINEQREKAAKEKAEEEDEEFDSDDVEEIELDPQNEKHLVQIQQVTAERKLPLGLKDVVIDATGVDEDSDFSVIRPPEDMEVTDSTLDGRDFEMTAEVPVEDVLKLGSDVREATRRADEEGDDEEEADKEAEEQKEDKEAKAEADQDDEEDDK